MPLDLRGLPSIANLVRDCGLAADKRLGQHFITDPAILDRIARSADVMPDENILEIGPGPGGLTRALLASGAIVTAVERDGRCIATLQSLQAVAGDRLRLVHADALKHDCQHMMPASGFKIVANLPYNIGTELLTRWLCQPNAIHSIHVLMQKEVVDRLAAAPGSKTYGRLSILAQLTSQVDRRFDLPAGAFHPPPKVTSSLVSLWPRLDAPSGELLRALQMVTHAAFQQRRKMLRVSLKGLPVPVAELLARAGKSPDLRPETLSPAMFLRLAEQLVWRQ